MELRYAVAKDYEIIKAPERGTGFSAGIDVSIPAFNEAFFNDFKKLNSSETSSEYGYIDYADMHGTPGRIRIPPHCRVIIPTGLRFDIPHNTYLEVANRGSMAAKEGFSFGAHIVDSDYRGILFVNLINTSINAKHLIPGQKFAQLLHKEVIMSEPLEMSEIDYLQIETLRGSGALASTGK